MAQYTDYKDVNQEQLQIDIDEIKKTIKVGEKDFQHLLKLERWGRLSTLIGAFLITSVIVLDATNSTISPFNFWFFGLIGVVLMGIANVARWANVTHPILHGAYDKVPNIPFRYTKKGFAAGNRRWIDWLDWIKPEAWAYEHNIMHHYHLGEMDDPDNVEKDVKWIHDMKVPIFIKYLIVFIFATVWKIAYYGPNTLRILENKERIARGEEPTLAYEFGQLLKMVESYGKTISYPMDFSVLPLYHYSFYH